MCIAIVKTKDGTITDDMLRTSFRHNPNGAGIAYTKDGELIIIKGIFNEDNFVQRVREVESIADSNILIHCRISTSGLVDVDNSHPHVVNDNTVLIHNGILDIDVPKDSTKSDTVLFIESYLKDLPIDFVYNKAIMKLIEDKIGLNNKFCFLNRNGDYFILNEKCGHWLNGVWYSNYSYEDWTKYTSYSNSKYYFEDEDEEYRQLYFMTRDEFLKTILDTMDKDKLKDMIAHLTDDELTELGKDPIIDVETMVLRPDDDYLGLHEFYLFELGDDIIDLYDMMYYGYDYEYGEYEYDV